MTYTTKYELGDEIWAMVGNRAVKKTIAGIAVRHHIGAEGKEEDPRFSYSVLVEEMEGRYRNHALSEDQLANTKEDLLAKL
jgi:hypothetical protein